MKLNEVAKNFLAISGVLSASIFVLKSMAWAETDLRFAASAENCPASFEVVDLGTWSIGETGEAVFGHGGLLYQVTQSKVLGRDQVLCLTPSRVDATKLLLDGSPVPLVKHFVDADLGARFIQRASGDYVQDVVAGRITPFPTNQEAVSFIEAKTAEFFRFVETAVDRGEAVSKGPNFTCIFDPENSNLAGYGNYSCVVAIEGLLHPDTYFQCSHWGGRCFAIFQPADAIVVTVEAGYLKHWRAAARIRSIQDAVGFWSELVLSSTKNFEASIVPRGRKDIKEVAD